MTPLAQQKGASTTKASAPRSIGVVGLGAWGAALALYCHRIGHSVTAWHRAGLHSEAIQKSRLLSIGKIVQQPLPDTLSITTDLAQCARCDFTIIALPASAWQEVLPKLTDATILVSATKGIEKTSRATPLTFAQQTIGIPDQKLCVLSGPSFASDLVHSTPISLVSASSSESNAKQIAESLSSETVRIYTSHDTLGVELGGILKNIISIAVGICDTLGYGPSTRAALITRGLAEMMRIATAWGADSQTLTGLSGLGDLVMTATDDQSRNRSIGLLLGEGESLSDAITTLGATAEGVYSAPLVLEFAKTHGIEVPIVHLVVEVLNGTLKPDELAHLLMTRPLKDEG